MIIDLELGENKITSICPLSFSFFSKVSRDSLPSFYIPLFKQAWDENAVIILKTLMNLRDIKNGKGERLISTVLFFCLKISKPTIYQNLIKQMCTGSERQSDRAQSDCIGCWKDVLYIMEFSVNYGIDNNFEYKLFATQLKEDINLLNNNPESNISLIGKWTPSEKTYYNNPNLLFEIGRAHV